MITLKLVWAWIKKHWKILLAVIGFIVGAILLRRSNVDLGGILQGIHDDHKKDVDAIRRKEEEISKGKEKLKEEERKKLEELDKKFDAEEKKLEEEKKRRAEEILTETGGDPDELAERLARELGSSKID